MSEVIENNEAANAPVLIQQMDQLSSQGARAESPLHHADLASVARQGNQNGGVVLQEVALLGHLVLRGNIDNADFTAGAEKVLGMALPGPLQSAENGELSLRWIAPDEWLLVIPGAQAFSIERELRDAMDGHIAIVNVSGGQTLLNLSGANARDLLMKSTGYDVHDRNFPVGKVVTTTFAKSQAVIRRTGEQSWELIIRRSFSDYLWLWLQDASAEFGLTVRT